MDYVGSFVGGMGRVLDIFGTSYGMRPGKRPRLVSENAGASIEADWRNVGLRIASAEKGFERNSEVPCGSM